MAAKNWLTGKDLTSVLLYTGTRGAGGVVTWNVTAKDLSLVPAFIRVSDMRVLEMIESVNALYAHYEKTIMDFALVVGEILTKKNTSPATVSILPAIAQGFDFLKVVFVRGGETYTFYGVIREFGDGVTSRGENTCEMTLAPYFDGTNSPLVMS